MTENQATVAQTCDRYLHLWGDYDSPSSPPIYSDETCKRAPHPANGPCSGDRDFDVEAWRRDEDQFLAEQRAWIVRLSQPKKESQPG